ncbi:MAG: alpha-galactosidase [Chloroflexi bacterium]|nr:alpha-galactosidase [Chloroflexota bacterium]
MRAQLNKAEAGATLRDVLAAIGPVELAGFLREGPGFDVRFASPPGSPVGVPASATIEPVDGVPGRYRVGASGIVADVAIEYSRELGAAVQQVTLTNESAVPSPPIRDLHAWAVPLEVFARNAPRACGFGGGQTHGFYPPRAYREEEVCFGEARRWEPVNPSFTRWITGRRTYILENEPGGRSSNPNLPLMQAGWSADGTADGGEVGLWGALEWSARWELHMGTGMDGRFTFRGGPKVQNLVLEPGETLRLPRVHVGVYGGPGQARIDGLNAIRRHVRDALAPDVEGGRPQPLAAYDHWFGIEQRLDGPLLRRQVDRAAELGLEYFVVDAAWYGGASENFANGVGNWERVDELKFPNGLEPLAEYVRAKGMRFGLWFEPERGRRGSDWVTQHPNWYWDTGNPVNLQLDLTRREVQDALVEMISTWIARLDIRWLRWDYNQQPGPFWDHVDPTGKVQFAYVEGLYRVWDTLLARHPNLMIDNCASGGNRVDFGTLRRAGTMVISDHAEDPHVCRLMQTGGARVFPANYMNSSVYVGEHDGDAIGPLELISRMSGSITLCGHIAQWSARHTEGVCRYLDGYRRFRHLLMEEFRPLTEYPRSPADWDAVEFVDRTSGEAVVLAYRVRGEQESKTVYPQGLDPEATYEIADPFGDAAPQTATGRTLIEEGLPLSLDPDSALVRHLKPVR